MKDKKAFNEIFDEIEYWLKKHHDQDLTSKVQKDIEHLFFKVGSQIPVEKISVLKGIDILEVIDMLSESEKERVYGELYEISERVRFLCTNNYQDE